MSERISLDVTGSLIRGEPIPYEEAVRGRFEPVRVGDMWGPPWSTTWFHVTGRVPDAWRGRRVVAEFDLGWAGQTGFTCEALAWKDGRPWRGVDPNHAWLPMVGPDVDFYLEAAANPAAVLSGEEPAPSMIALRTSPGPAFHFWQAELVARAESAGAPHPLDLGGHDITAVGHAHIDTAWLWPIRETQRKVLRSWSTQLELMDAHPDYVFAGSQAVHYDWVKRLQPDMYRRIHEKAASGQWEPVGGMWVEADCNLPSGESLVRQLLYGQRFFKSEFGAETRIVWLPDVFGYPGNLPQLIRGAGCDYFMTQKLSWNDTNKPEHHTFMWEGIDGTRVFTHFPPADTYNGDFSAEEVERSVRVFKDAASSKRSLYLFGFGDGGGGPTQEMIESAHSLGVSIGRATDFFDRAASEARDVAVVKGELYFEFHRGTYTSQARTKFLNRAAQGALRDAEMWSVAAGDYPREELDRLWKRLLLNQFHDILPGSSIDWVYEETEQELAEVVSKADQIADRSARRACPGDGGRFAVFNSASHARAGVPACGWRVIDTLPESAPALENEFLRVEVGDDGRITSIWDKEVGREVLSGPGNVLELHDDNPRRWDAWDIDVESRDAFDAVGRKFGSSMVQQDIRLDGRVIVFETQVEWHERHKMLKVAFPIALAAREATYEVQFGHVARPTHMDDSRARAMFEVCAQRWADLGDGDYGVAALNASKHGYDIHDGVMRLSLLRSPTHPDPEADQGFHRFTYALMPHRGDFREAGVIEAAIELNQPLRIVPTNLPAGTSRSLIEVDTRQVIVDTIKRAEDSDAVIVRLYEAWGRPCTARLVSTLPASRIRVCDLLERNLFEIAVDEGACELVVKPFQVVTLKLEP